MNNSIRIGIMGDFNPNFFSHVATNEAIQHAAKHLSITAEICWLPTPSLLNADGRKGLERCHGVWCSPGSPYQSMDGALWGIQFARERDYPFIGT
jgi:CTP synthase (UTP-ammonia lyase)